MLDQRIDWAHEFAKIVACSACSASEFPFLRRDGMENVPQPGYVGPGYRESRVLLVGQNPAMPPERLAAADRPYTAALRGVRDHPTADKLAVLEAVLTDFLPKWPVHEKYFPL